MQSGLPAYTAPVLNGMPINGWSADKTQVSGGSVSAPFVRAVFPVGSGVNIIQKQTPAGTSFIPIHQHLSSVCRSFYKKEDGDEYLLAEIYLVMMSGTGFCGLRRRIRPYLLGLLQFQLKDESFSSSYQGRLTRLITYLQRNVKVWRLGSEIRTEQGEQAVLEPAVVEHLCPYHKDNRIVPGYYWLELSISSINDEIFKKWGTPYELLQLIVLD